VPLAKDEECLPDASLPDWQGSPAEGGQAGVSFKRCWLLVAGCWVKEMRNE